MEMKHKQINHARNIWDRAVTILPEVYEKAIANVPPAQEKRFWLRYVYLWINYALYEELVAQDTDRTRQVYQACLKIIPHDCFTFAKIWLLYAKFEIQLKDSSCTLQISKDSFRFGIFDPCRTIGWTKFQEFFIKLAATIELSQL